MHKIEQIRSMYANGSPLSVICDKHHVSRLKVHEYCSDLKRPPPPRKLTKKQVRKLMESWK